MDLRRLKTFVTVAEQGTVSKAASVLHLTQPALSRQISGLEQELGFKLFGRVGRRLVLTTQGEQMVGECRNLLNGMGAIADRAHSLRAGKISNIRIVASALTIEGLFSTILNEDCRCCDGMKVKLIEAHAANHLDILGRGEADLSINVLNDLQIDDELFGTFVLPQFHVVAAYARNYKIESSETIDIRKLVRHPLLLLDRAFATRTVFDAACRLSDLRPTIGIESIGAHALLALAEMGHGIAIIPSALRTGRWQLRTSAVTQRRQPLGITLGVVWNRRRMPAEQAESCGEMLAAHILKTFPQL